MRLSDHLLTGIPELINDFFHDLLIEIRAYNRRLQNMSDFPGSVILNSFLLYREVRVFEVLGVLKTIILYQICGNYISVLVFDHDRDSSGRFLLFYLEVLEVKLRVDNFRVRDRS